VRISVARQHKSTFCLISVLMTCPSLRGPVFYFRAAR